MSIVAVSEKVEHAGVILMWTLRGATDLGALTQAWADAGLDPEELPEAPSPEVALRRAMNELREKHRLVRPLGRGNGYALVRENAEGDDLDYEIELKVSLDKVGRLTFTGGDFEARDKVRELFDEHAKHVSPEDMSAWLVNRIPKFDGVAMRATGGVYFIPHVHRPALDGMVQAIRAATRHVFYRIPAIHEADDASRSDVVQAILDSIEAEAKAEAEAMEQDLANAKYGARGYQHRIERTDTVEQKIGRYEALVGGKLDGIRERLETLRANLAVAVMKAQAEEEKRNGQASIATL